MSIRSLDWRDLPALHRYRKHCIFLNSALVLTRGTHLYAGSLLSYLAPASGIFTSVSTNNEDTKHVLIGQVIYPSASQTAQLTFLMPEEALESASLPELLDHLSVQVIEHGAFRLLAEIDERSQGYESLRSTSFSIYSRQRIWRIPDQTSGQEPSVSWQVASEQDLIPVRSLYHNTVPGLVQQVEPFPVERLNGMVFRQGEDVLAYIELKYGHRGIFAQPFIDPDAAQLVPAIWELLPQVPHRRSRQVYLCIRSYNSWLEASLEDIGAESGPLQAVMVKHLAVPQKAVRSFALPALEGGHPEVTAPISHSRLVKTGPSQTENNGY